MRKLGAVESAPLMEAAYAANKVDLSIDGDWEDAQVELGLLDKRITSRPNYILEQMFGDRLHDSLSQRKSEQSEANKLNKQRTERREANKRARKTKQKQRAKLKKKKKRK